MKKLITLFAIIMCLFIGFVFGACKNEDPSAPPKNESTETAEKQPKNDVKGATWENFGNGAGKYIPEPYQEYKINASTDHLSVDVHGVTETDFYDYVNQCKNNGFAGDIGTAVSPDIYFMAEHADGYKLQIFFYKDSGYYSIYAAKTSN